MDMKSEPAGLTVEALTAQVGREIGVSAWHVVSQDRIDLFADATDDHQFIHVDAGRAAAETPFGGTIAHGLLTLSLLPAMAWQAVPPVVGTAMNINYGYDKVRFLTPVPSGAALRGRFVLKDAAMRSEDRLLMTYEVTIELRDAPRPALVADWLSMIVLTPGTPGA